jgi:hypothetical protein
MEVLTLGPKVENIFKENSGKEEDLDILVTSAHDSRVEQVAYVKFPFVDESGVPTGTFYFNKERYEKEKRYGDLNLIPIEIFKAIYK